MASITKVNELKVLDVDTGYTAPGVRAAVIGYSGSVFIDLSAAAFIYKSLLTEEQQTKTPVGLLMGDMLSVTEETSGGSFNAAGLAELKNREYAFPEGEA